MRVRALMLIAALTFVSSAYANARDPFENEPPPPPTPAAPSPDQVAFVVPEGVHYVTDTYVRDVVVTTDATTTYSTTTVHESTGTYARVIDTVSTGATSAFDGMAFNGRGSLTDGRSLGGTYYENFVLTASGYVPVSIVFFQDDSETRRSATVSSPSPAPTASVAPTAPVTFGSTSPKGVTAPTPSPRPQPSMVPARPTLRAGIALASDGPTLGSAEVLRGRLIHFWPRVFANDVAVPIRSWRLVSALPDRVSAISGGNEPLAAQWVQMPVAGARRWLHFEIFTELAPLERLEAQIAITVRSPALVD